jgi:hypothetical protein
MWRFFRLSAYYYSQKKKRSGIQSSRRSFKSLSYEMGHKMKKNKIAKRGLINKTKNNLSQRF